MPIIRTYGDNAVFGQGAYDAGFLGGRAQRLAQQREIDARFTENRLGARERMAQIVTQNQFANQRAGMAGGGGQSQGSGPESVINEYAQERKKAKDEAAMLQLENDQKAREQRDVLKALDESYQGREKDFTYHYAKNQLMKGGKLPERIQSALGITTASEETAKARLEAESGQIDDAFEPKTQSERLVRRTLEQGRAGDIADMLGQRGKDEYNMPGKGPLTDDALAARVQLEGFATATSDKQALLDARRELESSGVDDVNLAILDERIEQLEQEETKVKAPAAFEQAVSTFQTRLNAMQTKAGKPATLEQKRKMLASTLEQTAESYGITLEQLGMYIRANDESRRQAEQLVQQAQELLQEQAAPAGAPTGTEQQYGPNEAQPDPRQRTQPAQPGMGPTDGGGWQNPPLIPSLNQ